MLRFVENFANYGSGNTGRANMLEGIWLQVGGQLNSGPQTAVRRGRESHSYRDFTDSTTNSWRRFGFGANLNHCWIHYGVMTSNIPADSDSCSIFRVLDSQNRVQFTVFLAATGAIEVRQGNSNDLIASTPGPVITAGAFYHLEMYAQIMGGLLEIRVNEIPVLSESGLTLVRSGDSEGVYAMATIPKRGLGSGSGDIYTSGLAMWDSTPDPTGAGYDDWMGDVQYLSAYPNAGTGVAQWAGGYQDIDDTTPDGDSSFIEANNPNDVSEFGMEGLPAEVSEVTCVVTRTFARKADAGSSTLQVSVVSGSDASAGADRPLTEVYSYYDDIHTADPATGVAWTPEAVNDMLLRVERTA